MNTNNVLTRTDAFMLQWSLSAILKQAFGEEVKITAVYKLAAIKPALEKEKFDLLIIDLQVIEWKTERRLLRRILKKSKPAKVLILYDKIDVTFCRYLLSMGVRGIIRATSDLSDVKTAILQVHNNEVYIDKKVSNTLKRTKLTRFESVRSKLLNLFRY